MPRNEWTHLFGARNLGFDDAIYVSCRFCEIVSQCLSCQHFLADQPKLYNTPELHTNCPDEKKFRISGKGFVRNLKKEGYDVNDIDGASITFPDGGA